MKEKILNYLRQKKKMSVTTQEMAKDLSLDAAGFRELVGLLSRMEAEHLIIFTDFGTVALAHEDPATALTGLFHANARGFGFVTIEGDDEDVFVGKGKTAAAMDGDTVALQLTKNKNALTGVSAEGVVTAVTSHAHTVLVGEFAATDKKADGLIGQIRLKNKKLPETALVANSGLSADSGDIVKLELTDYPTDKAPERLMGRITKIIGHAGDQGVDVLEVLEGMGIRSEFPEAVEAETAAVPEAISEQDLRGREDFRDEITYTIDGADSKDLDDAIHVKALADGQVELGVHIADVSYYVRSGQPLDVEALERGTSTYVTDRVVPMLPKRLSNGICSLNPQQDRLTQSCIMTIDARGRIISHRIVQSVIRTTYRMTYDDVNLMIKGDAATLGLFPKIAQSVAVAAKLHERLLKMREHRGALDFDTVESKILVDAQGVPTKIVKRERGVAERMIESFMLAANETVAKHFADLGLPFIYRIHEHPKTEKLTAFIDFATALGLPFKGTAAHVEQRDLQAFMRRIKGQESEQIMGMMLLRSMQQARYSEQNLGHYGLAAEYYTHFTSPIRRYPDLLVHRLIREYSNPQHQKAAAELWAGKIPEIAQQASSRERRSIDAERDVEKMKKAEYMQRFVGEEMAGVVSSVTSFGMFVELPDTVEGLVHVSTLKKDYFRFNERTLTMTGERSGLTFKIGQPIKIRVTRADKITGDVDFEYLPSDVDHFEKPKKGRRKPSADKGKRGDKLPDKIANKNKKPYYKRAARGSGKSNTRAGKGDGARGKKRGR